jgi:sugar transferase (PEP-CTERM system associated)
MMTKKRLRTLCLVAFEGAMVYGCGLAAISMRFGAEAGIVLSSGRGWLKILLLIGVVQTAFYLFDLYDLNLIRQVTVLILRISQALGVAAIVLALIFYALPQMMLGRGVFLVSLLLMLAAMMGWRLVAIWLLGHPRLTERVLILGTERGAIDLAREVLARRGDGYEIVGFVGEDPKLIGQSLINPCVVGAVTELEEVTKRYRVDRIVVALPDGPGRLPLDPLLNLRIRDKIAVEESASFYERLTGKIGTERLEPSRLIFADIARWSFLYHRGRRLMDLALALIGLLCSLPVMVLTAIAIRLDSPGPIFYTQERVGLHNRRFKITKFRSMRTDAEPDGPVWAAATDSRVTRVGRLIRKMRIDELPQFVSVLRGEMSLIGPRPERPEFVAQLEKLIPYYSQRHLVKPGLTGWAQICYPYGASFEDAREKHLYDLYYIKNQSFILDAIILLETVRIVLFGRLAR